MKLVNLFKTLVAPSVSEELAKLDAHLLSDIGYHTSNARSKAIRIPAEAGVRLV